MLNAPLELRPRPGYDPEKPHVIPDNVVVMAAHSSFELPPFKDLEQKFGKLAVGKLTNQFLDRNGIYVRDGSDYATGSILAAVAAVNPAAAVNAARIGRMFVNPNAKRDKATERNETFGGIPLWERRPSDKVEEQLLKDYWDTFHEDAHQKILAMMRRTKPGENMLVLDIHDTDSYGFNELGKLVLQEVAYNYYGFPPILVSNKDGQSAPDLVLDIVGKAFLDNFVEYGLVEPDVAKRMGVKKNKPYKGGYVTTLHGVDFENAVLLRGSQAQKEQVQDIAGVQVEIGRQLYMKLDRSGVDEERMERTDEASLKAIAEASDTVRTLDLGNWRTVPEPGSEAYKAAMECPFELAA